ncbi:malonate decarboxylase holo-[acyl-carrier-protein] synthase [Stenotrophomonas sp. ISL-67]|uniref:malonate decarboxylase holo-[acyl-carrier-protein] synthase n=1 Tax=Stenotrophomonas sp. ISL-67 TaxID=2819171 RepID=UPI001BE57789|nr:malonate decarboxylase holo-[acyl-carrier-protein] synthase [Stenotrophomonas sp. ISL-67]MBT2766289.1 malonate decarboxylase holo-[acyl-carrier-protein] synthase [Stenotrophomonas sp. ISL-67]
MSDRLARHTRVWLSAHADWRADVALHEPRLVEWFARGWPAVVARRAADDPDPRMRLGVPLPPAEGKQRLALRVPVQDIVRQAPPLALAEVIARPDLPAEWRLPLQAMAAIAPARVFGAFAWQALTGLAYVHARSDVDLLWDIADADAAEYLVERLRAWEQTFARRVDGELCLPGGAAVNWREYAGAAREVLVKRVDGAVLEARERIFGSPGFAGRSPARSDTPCVSNAIHPKNSQCHQGAAVRT